MVRPQAIVFEKEYLWERWGYKEFDEEKPVSPLFLWSVDPETEPHVRKSRNLVLCGVVLFGIISPFTILLLAACVGSLFCPTSSCCAQQQVYYFIASLVTWLLSSTLL